MHADSASFAGEYDSEETGTEESGSDLSEDESIPALDEGDSDGEVADALASDRKKTK